MTFETEKNGTIPMDKETFARWLCLMEGVDVAERKAEELNVNLDNWDWLKPLAFEKYISERFEGMMLDLDSDEKNNLIGESFVHYSNKPESKNLVIPTIS
jgi:hypothetical protein